MRILIVRPQIERGGAGKVILRLVQGLRVRNHTIFLATSGGEIVELMPSDVIISHIPLSPSSLINLFRSTIMIRKLVKQNNIDIINSHHRFATLVCNLATLGSTVRVVSTIHEIKSSLPLISKLITGHHSIVFSEAVKRHLIERLKITSGKISLVQMGISREMPLSKENLKEERIKVDIPPNFTVVACVARFSKEKGWFFLIQSVPTILRKQKNIVFLFVGDGPLKSKMIQLIRRLGIEKNVLFLGWQEDLSSVYEIIDILVVPSLSEAFGLSILEAFIYGKPVIASGVGGIPELIENGQNGFLIRPGDINSLTNTVVMLARDEPLRKKIGLAGKNQLKTGYRIDVMLDQTIAVFNLVLDKG